MSLQEHTNRSLGASIKTWGHTVPLGAPLYRFSEMCQGLSRTPMKSFITLSTSNSSSTLLAECGGRDKTLFWRKVIVPDRSSGHVNVICMSINVLLTGRAGAGGEGKARGSWLQPRDPRGWEFSTMNKGPPFQVRIFLSSFFLSLTLSPTAIGQLAL